MVTKNSNYPLRLSDETLGRIERLGEAMTARAGGAKVPRSSVLRAVIDAGLDKLEPELNATKSKR